MDDVRTPAEPTPAPVIWHDAPGGAECCVADDRFRIVGSAVAWLFQLNGDHVGRRLKSDVHTLADAKTIAPYVLGLHFGSEMRRLHDRAARADAAFRAKGGSQ